MDERGGAVDHAGGGEDAQRVERGRGQRHAPHQRQEQAPRRPHRPRCRRPSRPRTPRRPSRTSRRRSSRARSSRSSARSRPGRSRPDSPSRIVPVRPRISRPPSTEKVTAGSVGASAAPSRPLVIHERSKQEVRGRARSAPADANVPSTPSERIGTAEPRKRRQPMSRPPSKRITISATTPIRSTVTKEISSWSRGTRSEIDGRGDEEERGARDRQPLGDRAAEERQRDPAGDDEDDQTEVSRSPSSGKSRATPPGAAAYTFLT